MIIYIDLSYPSYLQLLLFLLSFMWKTFLFKVIFNEIYIYKSEGKSVDFNNWWLLNASFSTGQRRENIKCFFCVWICGRFLKSIWEANIRFSAFLNPGQIWVPIMFTKKPPSFVSQISYFLFSIWNDPFDLMAYTFILVVTPQK